MEQLPNSYAAWEAEIGASVDRELKRLKKRRTRAGKNDFDEAAEGIAKQRRERFLAMVTDAHNLFMAIDNAARHAMPGDDASGVRTLIAHMYLGTSELDRHIRRLPVSEFRS